MFFLWTILSQVDPQNFSYWLDVEFSICNFDVKTKAPMTSYSFPMSTCKVLILNLFPWCSFRDTEEQSVSIFPISLPHHMTYDVIIIIKTLYMSKWWKFCLNQISGCGEKHETSVQKNKNRQTDPNIFPLSFGEGHKYCIKIINSSSSLERENKTFPNRNSIVSKHYDIKALRSEETSSMLRDASYPNTISVGISPQATK